MGRQTKTPPKGLVATAEDEAAQYNTEPLPAKTNGRAPITVEILQFQQPGQEGPGLQMATSCSMARPGKLNSRHTIEYHPWYRAFKITYADPTQGDLVAYIPEHRVVCWYPA